MSFYQWTALLTLCCFIFGVSSDFIARRRLKLPPSRASELWLLVLGLAFVLGLCASAFLGLPKFEMLGELFAIGFLIHLVVDRIPRRKVPVTLLAMALSIAWMQQMGPQPLFPRFATSWLDLPLQTVGGAALVYVAITVTRYCFPLKSPSRTAPPKAPFAPIH